MSTPRAVGTLGDQDDNGMWIVETGGVTYLLNDTARAIWELCDGHTTTDEMIDAISVLTGLAEDRARKDVLSAFEEMAASGLITGWERRDQS